MSEFPDGWSEPSPVFNRCTMKYETGGLVWVGPDACTREDIAAAEASWGAGVEIDYPTCFGLPSYRDRKKATDSCYI